MWKQFQNLIQYSKKHTVRSTGTIPYKESNKWPEWTNYQRAEEFSTILLKVAVKCK